MMNMKYLLAGFSCAALLALAPAVVTDVPQVHAESTEEQGPENPASGMTVTINEMIQTMTVKSTEDTKIYVSFPTVKSGVVKDGKWASYDVINGKVDIDLSSKKVDKEFYVQVKGNATKAAKVYYFSAAPSKLKAVVDNATGTVKLQSNKTDLPADTAIQYATTNGDWQSYSGEALEMYQENGATLRFRTAPVTATTEIEKATEQLKNSEEETLETYNVKDVFASNEVKAKIGKRVAGPKLTVNYKNHTITVAKGNYRIYNGTVIAATKNGVEKLSIDLNKTFKETDGVVEDYKDNEKAIIAEAGAVEAWLDADTAKKKARSAYTEVAFEGVTVLNAGEDTSIANGGKITDAAGKTVEISTAATKGKEGKVDVTIQNKTDNAYEYIVSSSVPGSDTKWKTVKAGKPATVKAQDPASKLYVRMAADTKKKIWSSDYVEFGKLSDGTSSGGGSETSKFDFSGVSIANAEYDGDSTMHTITLTLPEGASVVNDNLSVSTSKATIVWDNDSKKIMITEGQNKNDPAVVSGDTMTFTVKADKSGETKNFTATYNGTTWTLS